MTETALEHYHEAFDVLRLPVVCNIIFSDRPSTAFSTHTQANGYSPTWLSDMDTPRFGWSSWTASRFSCLSANPGMMAFGAKPLARARQRRHKDYLLPQMRLAEKKHGIRRIVI
jgi:hypothetical protein